MMVSPLGERDVHMARMLFRVLVGFRDPLNCSICCSDHYLLTLEFGMFRLFVVVVVSVVAPNCRSRL